MATAPTLNRPPTNQPKLTSFASPPSARQGPTPQLSGSNPSLMQAAVKSSTKNSSLGSLWAGAKGGPPPTKPVTQGTLYSGAGGGPPAGTQNPPKPVTSGYSYTPPKTPGLPNPPTATPAPTNTQPYTPPGVSYPGSTAPNATPNPFWGTFGLGTGWRTGLDQNPNVPGSSYRAPVNPPAGSPLNPTIQSPTIGPQNPPTQGPATNDIGGGIPLIPVDETAKQFAATDFANAYAQAYRIIGEAAFGYGDPTEMARWGMGTINPNSVLALAALKAQQDTQSARELRGRAGTLFSGLAQRDFGRIADAQQRAQTQGYTDYQKALAQFNEAVTGATTAENKTIGLANADERTQALANMPTPATSAGSQNPSTTGSGGGGSGGKGKGKDKGKDKGKGKGGNK